MTLNRVGSLDLSGPALSPSGPQAEAWREALLEEKTLEQLARTLLYYGIDGLHGPSLT